MSRYNEQHATTMLNALQGTETLERYKQEIKADAIEKCAKVVSSMVGICQYSCPIGCEWGTNESCVELWKQYLTEQLKEQK